MAYAKFGGFKGQSFPMKQVTVTCARCGAEKSFKKTIAHKEVYGYKANTTKKRAQKDYSHRGFHPVGARYAKEIVRICRTKCGPATAEKVEAKP